MSPNMTSRTSSNIFTSYFWPTLMALVMAVFLSQWAVADPPAEVDASEITQPDTTPAQESIDLPPPSVEDGTVKSDEMPDTLKMPSTPALSTTPIIAPKTPKKCYEQTDGSFECVCEGEKECKLLESADYCEVGTHWGKDGYGGCTRISDE